MSVNSLHLALAVRALRCGGVIACATEGVWGVGCDPGNEVAVGRVLALKGRSVDKGLILVVGSVRQAEPYLAGLSPAIVATLRSSWPGPVTWLLPAVPGLPRWITGNHASVALRVSEHPQLQALCTAFGGAIVSTSANPQGLAPARNALAVRKYFGRDIDYVLPGELGGRKRPSEIRDALTGRVLRAG